jgi:hypothetical protein
MQVDRFVLGPELCEESFFAEPVGSEVEAGLPTLDPTAALGLGEFTTERSPIVSWDVQPLVGGQVDGMRSSPRSGAFRARSRAKRCLWPPPSVTGPPSHSPWCARLCHGLSEIDP